MIREEWSTSFGSTYSWAVYIHSELADNNLSRGRCAIKIYDTSNAMKDANTIICTIYYLQYATTFLPWRTCARSCQIAWLARGGRRRARPRGEASRTGSTIPTLSCCIHCRQTCSDSPPGDKYLFKSKFFLLWKSNFIITIHNNMSSVEIIEWSQCYVDNYEIYKSKIVKLKSFLYVDQYFT